MTDLDKILEDLAAHPDSSAREIGQRLGMNDRWIWRLLNNAAYDGRCQRWHDGGSGSPWRWEIPPS